MNFALFILVFSYILLVFLNFKGYVDNKSMRMLTIVTIVFSTLMLFSANSADIDWSETQLDMSGYRTIYEKYNALEYRDADMYYLFYGSMHLGQYYGISYRTWWTIMSVLAMIVILITCRIHKYSLNFFLATFMAFYEMVFYSGFKFFYGFCFLLLAYGFLLRNNLKGKLLFVFFTFVAGNFHVMYYFFLVLLLYPMMKSRFFMVITLASLFSLLTLMRASDSALSFLQPFFDALDNEHINRYTEATVHFSFYIVLFVHLVVVYIAYRIRKHALQKGVNTDIANTLYSSVLLSLIFCPFYTIAFTFMRLITAFSFVVILAGSIVLVDSRESRKLCMKLSLLMIITSYLIRIATGGFIETAIVPYFDVL